MDDFASLRDSTPQTASAEDVWPDLNPVEMVEHFAKLENYDENAPLSELISLERQLSWSAKLSLSELEEFFEPSNVSQPPAPQLQPQPQYSQQPHHDRDLHSEQVRVTLLHRTRNAQGCEWQMVASKEEIRVTRNRGKLFKVVVESSAPFTRNDVHLFLADSSVPSLGSSPAHGTSSYDPSSSSSSPSTSPPASSPLQLSAHDLVVQSIDEVQPSKTTGADGRPTSYSVEVKVKLCLIGKGIQIAARITPPHGRASVGRSVEFMTHNNGKQKLRTEAKKKKEKEKTTTTTKKKRSGSKLSRVDGSEQDSHQELPVPASAAAASSTGLKVEPDTGGIYDLPEQHMSTPMRGSSTDYTGEMSSSGSDEDELRHHMARVPLVAPSFYSVSDESQHQQPMGQHHTMATPQQPYSGVAGGFERSETPTMARRQYDGMTPRGSMIDASGEMDIGRVTVVDDSGGPSHHPAAYLANGVGGGLNTEPEAAAGMAMGGSADMAHGAMGMTMGMGMDGGGMFLPNDGSYGGGVGNAEDLSDYGRGEPMLAPGLLNRHAGRKRKMDGMHGGGGGGGGRGSSPYPDHLSIRGGLHVEGIVRAQGFMQYSDLRLKTNVEDIVDAVSLISKLEGKRYRWKSQEEVEQLTGKSTPISLQNNGGLKVIGLIAQQVQQVLPEVVREDEDGFLSVDYVEIIPVLIEAFNQHLEVYHREQKELKSEFDTWRRLLGDKDEPSTEKKKSAESSTTMLKELIMVKKQPGGKTAGLTRRARNDSSGSEADLEAARSPIDDEEPDSLDRSSGSTTDGEEDVEEDFRHNSTPLMADQAKAAGVAGGAEEQSDLLAVDLDRLVANKGHLASLAAQMNKLIPDRQYTDLLKYVRDQKKSDRKRNRRLFFLFVFACLALFAINIAVSIGVPFGVTYIAESHV